MLTENLRKIQKNIDKYAQQPVTIVAVSKYTSDENVIKANQLGIKNFAENFLQDALARKSRLEGILSEDTKWHFTGHLQTNKVNKTVENFSLIQSVDSIKLLEKINNFSLKSETKTDILLQVNVSNEKQKFGFSLNEFDEVYKKLMNYEAIRIRGLMTLTKKIKISSRQNTENSFKILYKLGEDLKQFYQMQSLYLSMGMSSDYIEALQTGSNMIRIGRALFDP